MLNERLLTTEDIHEMLQVEVRTVRGWIRSGRLPAYLPGGHKLGYRVRSGDLARFLEATRVYHRPSKGDAGSSEATS
jgi:excisionase family DNA binding protein